MPRKSAASLQVIPLVPEASRLLPPANLSEPERIIFRGLVSAVPPDHFRASDMPLIVQYCQAIALGDEASAYIRKEGAVVAGRASPWLIVLEKCQRAVVALSMRLRLSPQARAPRAKADTLRKVSAYDLMDDD